MLRVTILQVDIISIHCNPNLSSQGLKTGMYYLRTKPAANAIQFTVDKSKLKSPTSVNGAVNGTPNGVKSSTGSPEQNMAAMVCSLENKDECLMCGS